MHSASTTFIVCRICACVMLDIRVTDTTVTSSEVSPGSYVQTAKTCQRLFVNGEPVRERVTTVHVHKGICLNCFHGAFLSRQSPLTGTVRIKLF